MPPKWQNGRLDLGRLGVVRVLYDDDDSVYRGWFYEWTPARGTSAW